MNFPNLTKDNVIVATLCFAVFVLVAYVSSLSVWVVDDYAYQFNLATNYTERIQNVRDVFESQIFHYMEWNGRFIAHVTVQFFVGLFGQIPFSIVNGLAYLLLAYLLLLNSGAKKDLFSWIFVLLATLVCFNDLFAAANQINYIWMALLVCSCLYIYFNKNDNHSTLALAGLFLFCVIAGNAHDAYNVPVGGALFIFHVINRKTITKKQWVMFAGLAIGGLFLCLAPGTLSRTDGRSIPFVVTVFNLFTKIKMPYILILLLVIKRKSLGGVKSFVKENYFWFCVILISVLFNFVVGIQVNRQLFAIELASIVLVLRLLNETKAEKIGVGIAAVLTCFGYIQVINAMRFEKNTYSEIERLYLESESGVIYYDIPYNDKCKWMTPIFYVHNNNPYNAKCITTFGLTVNYNRGLEKKLVVLPTEMQTPNADNCVRDLGDGAYLLVQNKQNPAEFYIQREYRLACFSKFKDEIKVDFEGSDLIENETNRAMYFRNMTPFVNNIDVKIKR